MSCAWTCAPTTAGHWCGRTRPGSASIDWLPGSERAVARRARDELLFALVNRRSISRLVAFGAALLVPLVPAAGITAAQTPPAPPAEAYPPAAVSNVIDPFICGTTTLNGVIGEVQAGSTVTVELMRASGPVLATQTVTARADGLAIYSIPVPPNSSGDIVIRATGTNTTGQPFTIETSGFVPACPTALTPPLGAPCPPRAARASTTGCAAVPSLWVRAWWRWSWRCVAVVPQ